MTTRVSVLTRAVAPLHPPGGMERAVYEQLRHLAALGLAIQAVTQPPYPATATWVPPADLATIDWRFVRYGHLPLRRNSVVDRLLNYPLFVRAVGRALTEPGAGVGQIVHAHGLLAAAAPSDRPLVQAPHGLEEFSRGNVRKWLAYAPMRATLRRTARRAAVVLATDQAMAPAVVQALRVEPSRVVVIPNGVSVQALDVLASATRATALVERWHLVDREPRLVTVARLERNKGLHVAIAALASIQHQMPPAWHWTIVGTGREQRALEDQIAAAGLGAHIRLVGHLADDDLHALLPRMHLYLMPSLYEGSSIATLEAMVHRLPVLATRVGGLPDKVTAATGYLTEPNDIAALARTLLLASDQRSRWPFLGQAGRHLVETAFDWPAIALQLDRLYRSLLPNDLPR